ncbi:MAG: DUF4912 domain-containing protein [Candidatus Omnitrophica bacterium]|nr:DUF4912 domain-containing protein [Candidatus Omnitrophota bacterium]
MKKKAKSTIRKPQRAQRKRAGKKISSKKKKRVVLKRKKTTQSSVQTRKQNNVQAVAKKNLLDRLVEENKKHEKVISQKVNHDHAIHEVNNQLPSSYNQTHLVLMVRDPYWVYAYWDLSEEKKKEVFLYLQKHPDSTKTVLRVYDTTDTDSKENTSDKFFDIEIPLEIGQWYLYMGLPDRKFIADLGIVDKTGDFYLIAWSNQITMPRDTPSHNVDAQWAIVDGVCNELSHLNQAHKGGSYHPYIKW